MEHAPIKLFMQLVKYLAMLGGKKNISETVTGNKILTKDHLITLPLHIYTLLG
jgi:hypothetical protein